MRRSCRSLDPHRATAGLLVVALLGLTILGPLPAGEAAGVLRDHVPDELLVGFHDGVAPAAAEAVYQAEGGRRIEQIRRLNVYRIRLDSRTLPAVAKRLRDRPEIAFVERNRRIPLAMIPDDPSFPDQWHHPVIRTPQAWDISTGSTDVVIAILDTGVDAGHPDLTGQLVPGWNFHGNNEDTFDVHGHGTLVAGVAAAAGNNGIGVTGVAMQSRIMPVRVADADGYAYYSAIASALTWAADSGARVMNVSFDGLAASSAVRSAARYVGSRGGVVVAAAGNCGCHDPTLETPHIISVGATTSSDVVASWSSRGAHVDVAAPGAAIYTTARGGSYRIVSGTSFASPIAAGVIALMMAANPTLGPAELEALLKANADDLGEPGRDPQYGYGRVNAERAVGVASGGQDAPTPPGSTTFSLALQLGTSSAVVGQAVQASFTGVSSGWAMVVDVFLVILLPPGAGPGLGCPQDDAVAFLTGVAEYVVTCASAPPQTFPALFPGLAWSAGGRVSAPDLLSLVWPAGAPTGPYMFVVFLTPAGALSDGVIDATDVLAVAADHLIGR